jgi:hypothetical protein
MDGVASVPLGGMRDYTIFASVLVIARAMQS